MAYPGLHQAAVFAPAICTCLHHHLRRLFSRKRLCSCCSLQSHRAPLSLVHHNAGFRKNHRGRGLFCVFRNLIRSLGSKNQSEICLTPGKPNRKLEIRFSALIRQLDSFRAQPRCEAIDEQSKSRHHAPDNKSSKKIVTKTAKPDSADFIYVR
jgi:hypothetical protein